MRANVSHANAHTRTGTRKSLALHMHMRFYVLTCVHVRARACVHACVNARMCEKGKVQGEHLSWYPCSLAYTKPY